MSDAYRLLEIEVFKSRVSQNMPEETINELTARLTPEQQQTLTRLIVRAKSVNHRTTQDCYILTRCCTSLKYFLDILQGKGYKALEQVCKHLYYNELPMGKTIYSIGDVADKLYVVSQGEVAVLVPQKQVQRKENGQQSIVQIQMEVARLQMGDVFGQTSTAKEKARRAVKTVTLTACELFEIKKRDYDLIVKFLIVSEIRARYMFLEEIELFSNLDRTSFQALIYTIEEKDVNIGHVLFREGDPVDNIYVIKNGEFRLDKQLVKDDSTDSLQRLRFVRPNHQRCNIYVVGCREVLGDVEACNLGRRQHTCTCITQTAQLYVLSRTNFQQKVMQNTNNNHSGIAEYIYSKSTYLNRRVNDFRRLSQLVERKKISFAAPKGSFVFAQSGQSHTAITQDTLEKINNREYDGELEKFQKTSPPRKRSIRSHKLIPEGRSNTLAEVPGKRSSKKHNVPFAVRMISDIVQQKKRYNDIRGTHYANAFDLNPELPTYFIVKMNLINTKGKCKTQGHADSPSKPESPAKNTLTTMIMRTPEKDDRYLKRKPRTTSTSNDLQDPRAKHSKTGTPNIAHRKYFQTMLYS